MGLIHSFSILYKKNTRHYSTDSNSKRLKYKNIRNTARVYKQEIVNKLWTIGDETMNDDEAMKDDDTMTLNFEHLGPWNLKPETWPLTLFPWPLTLENQKRAKIPPRP